MNIENIETAKKLFEEREKIESELEKLKLIQKDSARAFSGGSNIPLRYLKDDGPNNSGYRDGSIRITPDELRHILINRINDTNHRLFLVENKISKL